MATAARTTASSSHSATGGVGLHGSTGSGASAAHGRTLDRSCERSAARAARRGRSPDNHEGS
jgi:hypothetical protein